ncbi:gluconokinase [Cryobacterium sp. BB307]|uniref:gluconokinase n=1 Tax=Cryobacterium sp. BB307 TaxID=2716317 RepID=UPI0032BF82F9
MKAPLPPIVVMGVQGSGKSTIGTLLARRLGVRFIDGDRLHPDENIVRMAAGVPLTDEQRRPWLQEVGRVLADGSSSGIVAACSALKREYRDLLRESAPDLFVVDAEGPMELVEARIMVREHEFMPHELLSSQYAILEPLAADETGVVVDISRAPAEIVDDVVATLAAAPSV